MSIVLQEGRKGQEDTKITFSETMLACYASKVCIHFIHMVVLASKKLPKKKMKQFHFPLINDTVANTSLV